MGRVPNVRRPGFVLHPCFNLSPLGSVLGERAGGLGMHTICRSLAAVGGVILFASLAACVSPSAEAPAVPEPPPVAPDKDIWTAAAEGDVGVLEGHKRAGADLDAQQPDFGLTALAVAAGSRQQRALAWLLDNGADVNAWNRDGGTALHAAAFMGNAGGAAVLLENGADPDAPDGNGATPRDILELDWPTTAYIAQMIQVELDRQAVEAGRAAIVAMLGGTDAGAMGGAIWEATVAGDVDAVRRAIGDGAEVDAVSPDGAPLVLMAAALGHLDILVALLDAGAQINAAHAANGSTALHAAAFLGHAEVAELLLARGSDVDALSQDGLTARQLAEIDWATTEYIAGLLEIDVNRDDVMSGRAQIIERLTE